jgi:hypothetical protein
MAQNNLIGFFSGLFSNSTPSDQEIQVVNTVKVPAIAVEESAAKTQLTGVARYLNTLPAVTGVTKYLKNHPELPATGVAKYVVKQSMLAKDTPVLTGVAKYVSKNLKDASPATRVDRYLASQALLEKSRPVLTGVAKYINKQASTASNVMLLTGVAKYQAEQDLLAKKEAAAVMIAKYLAAEASAANAKAANETAQDVAVEPVAEVLAATGLGRYLQAQAKLAEKKAPVSGVAKYLARQIIVESQKPALTRVAKYLSKQQQTKKPKPVISSVARYLEGQVAASTNKPALSGVSKYLSRQAILEKNKPQLSGVAKYLTAQSVVEKPVAGIVESAGAILDVVMQSSVAKYLERQAQLALEALAAAEESLVGEYIPANEVEESFVAAKEAISGVSRYIEKKLKVEEWEKLTGVQKYLSQRA